MAKFAESHPKEPRPFIILSSCETLGWSVALFILFGWLFFLGVLVGRGSIKVDLIPTQVQLELAVVIDKKAVSRLGKEGGAPKETVSPVKLSFYKEVKQGEEAVTKSSRMTKAEKLVITPEKAAVLPLVKASPAVPIPPPVVRPAPQEAISVTDSGFTIQVAAHIDEAAAKSEANALRNQGFPAYFIAAKNGRGQTWYRVRVGRFSQRIDANRELSRLIRLKSKAYVVKL